MSRGERTALVLVNVLVLVAVVAVGVLAQQRVGVIATVGTVVFAVVWIVLLRVGITRRRESHASARGNNEF